MNETELIRRQLASERAHVGAVAQVYAQALRSGEATPGPALAEFHEACVQYLRCVLGWFAARDRRLRVLAAGLGTEDPRCSALNALLARAGSAEEALERLGAAGAGAAAAEGLCQFLQGPWSSRRDALERLLASDPRAADWRRISGIDADGILQERTGFARVTALLPAGMQLPAAPLQAA